jgi:hypothetical protein
VNNASELIHWHCFSKLKKKTLLFTLVNSAAVEQGSTVGVGVFGGEVACVFFSKKHVFIAFGGVVRCGLCLNILYI